MIRYSEKVARTRLNDFSRKGFEFHGPANNFSRFDVKLLLSTDTDVKVTVKW